ncbi:hypothetical protein GQ602_000577 [Ophiocordyceps camponoti-floridani]|uniref:Uncharacterized protein n=1 Tax=Ophiocordyceps camponoti-floridani TaxID=2030778 RepID=A0A8H4QCF4_9HYPO|nr:hypothetical protein GQ602_000577 [Ophiocordyceps camponoti-floridani]
MLDESRDRKVTRRRINPSLSFRLQPSADSDQRRLRDASITESLGPFKSRHLHSDLGATPRLHQTAPTISPTTHQAPLGAQHTEAHR